MFFLNLSNIPTLNATHVYAAPQVPYKHPQRYVIHNAHIGSPSLQGGTTSRRKRHPNGRLAAAEGPGALHSTPPPPPISEATSRVRIHTQMRG